jgi:hypothetical protein
MKCCITVGKNGFIEHDLKVVNTPLPQWSNVHQIEPGWLYILKNHNLIKVGKTTNPNRRLFHEARTWLPDMEVIGIKPFWQIHDSERLLLCGLANCWYSGEWHHFPDGDYSDYLTDGFRLFDDHDRNGNSLDFIYWISGSGMGEVIREQNHRKISLRRWQREA